MKCKLNTKDLKTTLALHKKIIGTKTQVFILAGIKLKTDDDSLELFSTNLEQSLKTKLECEVISTGEVVLPFNVFNNTVNVCDDEFIDIEFREEVKTRTETETIEEPRWDDKANKWIAAVKKENEVEYKEYRCKVDKMLINALDLE